MDTSCSPRACLALLRRSRKSWLRDVKKKSTAENPTEKPARSLIRKKIESAIYECVRAQNLSSALRRSNVIVQFPHIFSEIASKPLWDEPHRTISRHRARFRRKR